VVAGLPDQGDVDVGAAQPLSSEQAAEAGADDDDARAAGGRRAGGRDTRW
jgi:hypothetical protein